MPQTLSQTSWPLLTLFLLVATTLLVATPKSLAQSQQASYGQQTIVRLPPVVSLQDYQPSQQPKYPTTLFQLAPTLDSLRFGSAREPKVRLANATPPTLSEPVVDEAELERVRSGPPPGEREGIFQGIHFTGAWTPATSGGDLGVSDLELYAVFGFPLLTKKSPLLVVPAFGVHYFDGPDTPDLPARVYDATVQFRWLRPLGPNLTADIGVTPGVHSDFEQNDSEAFRIDGRALGIWKYSATTTFVLGVVYLDRPDVNILPAGGIIYQPNDCLKLELLMPRPRIAYRFWSKALYDFENPTFPVEEEYWVYLAAEFGGGIWSIERASGAQDVAILREYRVLFGLEHKMPGSVSARYEAAYVFGRELEYKSATPDYHPSSSVLLRVGLSY